MNEQDFAYLKKKVRELTRFDLDNYSPNQMMRRLDGFIARTNSPSVMHYCKLLEQDAEEVDRLQKFLTIHVSEFFRDPEQYDILQKNILPELLKQSPRLNIWSAGCSNGAEVYSVAMILDSLSIHNHRMLATDIDQIILSQAKAGDSYSKADVKNVPKTLLSKHFVSAQEDKYALSDNIKRKVVFKQHDLTRDAFGSDYDLIICRNTVIYFNDDAKKKLRRRFFDALKPNGILFIGATETMPDAADIGFQRLSPCFYRKTIDVPYRTNMAATVTR